MDNDKKQITRSEFIKLRDVECFTIDRLASYYNISAAAVRRVMKQWGMPTESKGRQRALDIELIDDTITRIPEVTDISNTENQPINYNEHEGA